MKQNMKQNVFLLIFFILIVALFFFIRFTAFLIQQATTGYGAGVYGEGNYSYSISALSSQFNITNIMDCAELNTSDITYNLTRDVNAPGTCFNITADRIALIGNGFLVNYSTSQAGYGVYINGFDFVYIANTRFVDNRNSGSAIYLNNSNNDEVDKIEITINSDNSYGIYILGNNNDIRSSNISVNSNDSNGVFSNGQDNSIVDNVINTIGKNDSGIFISGLRNKVKRNLINVGGILSNAIIFSSDSNAISENNRFIGNSNNTNGIFLIRSSLGSFSGDYIETNGTSAVGIRINSTNAQFNNLKIFARGSSSYGIITEGGINIINISGSYIESVNDNDIFLLGNSGDINLINFTLSANDIGFSANTNEKVNVYWYFDVYVRNELFDSLSGVNIELRDSAKNFIFSDISNGSGDIMERAIMDYSINRAGITDKNPHNITATKTGYAALSQQITINTNTKAILTMILSSGAPPEEEEGAGEPEGPKTYRITEFQLARGISTNLSKGDKTNLSLFGKYYTIKYDSFSGNKVIFVIGSQKVTFVVGDEKRFDFDKDGKEDVVIRLNGLKNGVASLYLKKIIIEEPEEEKNETIEECNANNCDGECQDGVCILEEKKAGQGKRIYYIIWILSILILIVVAIIIYLVIKKGRSSRKPSPLLPKPKSQFPMIKPQSKIQPPLPRRPLISGISRAKPSSDNEIEETFKKLKEIGESKDNKKKT